MFQPNRGNHDFNKIINELKVNFKLFGKIIVVVFLVIGAFTSFYTVDPDEEAVIIRFGKYVETTTPGLNFKFPFGIDRKIIVKTKRIHQAEFGFRTKDSSGDRTEYSTEVFNDESLMLTGDLNVADVEWVVQFQISDPYKFLFTTSSPERNIRDISESIMRRVIGDRLVNEVLTVGRVEIADNARVLMQEVLDRYDMGVRVVTVKLQDVNPPDRVKASFNEVNEATQEQEKMMNQAERSYNQVIPEAKGKAQKVISEAEGFASALVNQAKGDASKFEQMFFEYKRAPQVTKKRIYIETMEKLFARFEDVAIVDPEIKGLLPIYNNQSDKK